VEASAEAERAAESNPSNPVNPVRKRELAIFCFSQRHREHRASSFFVFLVFFVVKKELSTMPPVAELE
jgi:hypothetical protein